MKKNKSALLKKRLRMLPSYTIAIVWVAFIFVTMGWVLLASLSTTKEIFNGTILRFESGIHWENFTNALFSNNLLLYFFNSLLYTGCTCVGLIAVAAPASYVLARCKFRGNTLLKMMFMSAMAIPAIMVLIPVHTLISHVTQALNIGSSRVALIFVYICINAPFSVFFLTNFFESLPSEFEEAAAIDGCSDMKIFWKIMCPLAQPGIVTLTIFNFLGIWNEYFLAMVLVNDPSMRPLALGLNAMVEAMRYSGDWAGMFAALVLVFLPTCFVYAFLSSKIVNNVTSGGVKG